LFLMYVDESGDPGIAGSPTRYFILTGVVIHELRWKDTLETILQFRKDMKVKFGLKLREEIHAAKFINSPGSLIRIKKNDRLTILRSFADLLAFMPDLSIINVVIDKKGKTGDIFELAWKTLIQRFENTISHRNFPGPVNQDERGLIFPDATDVRKLRGLIRKMRQYNPIPNQGGGGYRNLQLSKVIEDPNFRNSDESYLIQAADLVAYLLYQNLTPNAYMRKKSGNNYFNRLDPVLCKVASTADPQGIVRL
jgi:Protein of unknown function (DUF3800)